jgi:hypothetical protein
MSATALVSKFLNFVSHLRCCCCCRLLPLAAAAAASLNWGKLGLRYWEVGLRRGAVYTVLLLLALFYVLPVAFVQGILQVSDEWHTCLRWPLQAPAAQALHSSLSNSIVSLRAIHAMGWLSLCCCRGIASGGMC